MKIKDVFKLDEKIGDDDKARIRKAAGKDGKVNVKPLVQLAKNKQKTDEEFGDDIKEAQDALRQRYNQLDELESQAAATAKGLVPQAARNAFNAVTGGIKGALTGKGVGASARQSVQGAKTQTQVSRISRDVVARWNQKTSANPDFQTDRELYKFIAQYWKHTPEDERPSPPKGAGQNPKKAEAYIQQIISNELAHGEFGQREQPQQQGQQQQGQQQATEIPQGMKQTTQTDPKKIPKGTMFTVYQAKGPGGKGGKEVMYRWEGGQWTLNTGSGKWQTGQIKNDLAFKLYLDAVKNGKAMSPIAGDPDAGTATIDADGKKVEPSKDGQQGDQAQVDANKDGKDDKTGEPMKSTGDAAAGAAGAAVAVKAGDAVTFTSKAGNDTSATVVSDAPNDPESAVVKTNTGNQFTIKKDKLKQPEGGAQAQQGDQAQQEFDPKRLDGAMNSIKTANSASLSALEELLKIEKAA